MTDSSTAVCFISGAIPVWASLLGFQVWSGGLLAVQEAFVLGSVWRWLRCGRGASGWSWARSARLLRLFGAGSPPGFGPVPGSRTSIKTSHGSREAAGRTVRLSTCLKKQEEREREMQKKHQHDTAVSKLTYMCCFSFLDLLYNFCHGRSLLPAMTTNMTHPNRKDHDYVTLKIIGIIHQQIQDSELNHFNLSWILNYGGKTRCSISIQIRNKGRRIKIE